MGMKTYLIKKGSQGLLVASGVFLGVNNYDILSELRSSLVETIAEPSPRAENLYLLEDFLDPYGARK